MPFTAWRRIEMGDLGPDLRKKQPESWFKPKRFLLNVINSTETNIQNSKPPN